MIHSPFPLEIPAICTSLRRRSKSHPAIDRKVDGISRLSDVKGIENSLDCIRSTNSIDFLLNPLVCEKKKFKKKVKPKCKIIKKRNACNDVYKEKNVKGYLFR